MWCTVSCDRPAPAAEHPPAIAHVSRLQDSRKLQLLACVAWWESDAHMHFISTKYSAVFLQDFWNVSADDPLVHFARFFYGECLMCCTAYTNSAISSMYKTQQPPFATAASKQYAIVFVVSIFCVRSRAHCLAVDALPAWLQCCRPHAAGQGWHRCSSLLRHRGGLPARRAGVSWRPGIWFHHRGEQQQDNMVLQQLLTQRVSHAHACISARA